MGHRSIDKQKIRIFREKLQQIKEPPKYVISTKRRRRHLLKFFRFDLNFSTVTCLIMQYPDGIPGSARLSGYVYRRYMLST